MLDGFVPWPNDLAEDYRRQGLWLNVPLGDLLHESCLRHADRTAVVCGNERLTYRALSERSDRLARGLLTLGLRPSDRVVVQLPNVPEFVVVVFALLRAGLIPVLALPGHRRAEIASVTAHADAMAYIIKDEHDGFDYRQLAREIDADPLLVIVDGEAQEFIPLNGIGDDETPLPDVDPAAPALILLSGGTTGAPKLIPRAHDDYAFVMRATADAVRADADFTYLAVNPAAHQAALACPGIFGTLLRGGKAVLSTTVRPDVVFPLIRQEGVTFTTVVPAVLKMWVDSQRARGPFPGLVIQVGSAPLDPELARRAGEVLGCRIMRWYGISEGLLTHTRFDDPDDVAMGTEGRPMTAYDEVRVVDRSGAVVADGEIGEMLTRGPYTIRGYFRAPEVNAHSFTSDGFFRTGDLVRRSMAGDITVVGRAKEVINRAGEKVSAEEVERQLRSHPAVEDAAVVGVADDRLGERTYAFLVSDVADLEAPAVKRYLHGCGLATYKIPDRVVRVEELPRTAMGKVDKNALRLRATGPAT